MSWRTVIITSNAKLDYSMGYLIVRTSDVKRVFLSEISVLIIESTAVSLTSYLINELIKKNIKVIFCNEYHQPVSEIVSIYGNSDSSDMVRKQIAISSEIKRNVWMEIIYHKIKGQKRVLELMNKQEAEKLDSYMSQVSPGDLTNREGFAAKVYFNSLFGMEFSRNEPIAVNAALNYGYSILCSAISREIVANGFLTQLGIFHNNHANHFNLSCDLMEPFRPFIDYFVIKNCSEDFSKEDKKKVISFFQTKVIINTRKETIYNAISIYVKSVLDKLLAGSGRIKFPEFDE